MSVYIAMNRFQVPEETAQEFEEMWLTRESHLHEENGFVEFHMLKGPTRDGVTLYASHTVWASEEDFINWTKGQNFRDSHKGAGQRRKLFEGHPTFEGFSAIQHITL